MCEAMEQGFEEIYGDKLRAEVAQALAQARKDTMALVRQVRTELKKGTSEEEICTTLGVDMSFVEACL